MLQKEPQINKNIKDIKKDVGLLKVDAQGVKRDLSNLKDYFCNYKDKSLDRLDEIIGLIKETRQEMAVLFGRTFERVENKLQKIGITA